MIPGRIAISKVHIHNGCLCGAAVRALDFRLPTGAAQRNQLSPRSAQPSILSGT